MPRKSKDTIIREQEEKIKKLQQWLESLEKENRDLVDKADEAFANSTFRMQLEAELDFYKNLVGSSTDKKIVELPEEIKVLRQKSSGSSGGRPTKLSSQQREEIRKMKNNDNMTYRAIASKIGCSIGLVHKVVNEQKKEKN